MLYIQFNNNIMLNIAYLYSILLKDDLNNTGITLYKITCAWGALVLHL